MLDLFFIHLPGANVKVFLPALFFIGFSVGVISSFLGIGGAWMVTPALNIMGFPMPYAIGTDIMHIAGKSCFATYQHAKMKNIDYKLALYMVIGTVIGIEIGSQIIMYLEKLLIVDSVVRWAYIIFLILIFIFIIMDLIKQKYSNKGFDFYKKLQNLKIPPITHFKTSDITCTIWLPIAVGFITGILAGFLGIGGGLFRLPALIYLVGCPVVIAVGTDIFEVLISGCYGAISYSIKGRVDFFACFVMLIGASIGAKIGANATNKFSEKRILLCFSIALLGCLLSLLLKQISYNKFSLIIIFGSTGLLACYVTIVIFKHFLKQNEKLKKT
jgi:uncharacterized protein